MGKGNNMGYSTDFNGRFELDRPLAPQHKAYLDAFSRTRRMQRDETKTASRPDSLREAVGLPVGVQGGYFVGSTVDLGQEQTDDVTQYNDPPVGQPGLWCQWSPSDDSAAIIWDSGEKFYNYVEWIAYLIDHFLAPWGYVVNGEVDWSGESSGDIGKIVVTDNAVSVKT